MAMERCSEDTVRRAVSKALKVDPLLLELCEGWWVAQSGADAAKGYMLEVFEGKVTCECQGFERVGGCYHAAALSIRLGLMAPRFIVGEPTRASERTTDGQIVRHQVPVRSGYRGKQDLFA